MIGSTCERLRARGCRDIVLAMTNGPLPYAVSDLVLGGFLRVVTHPRVFDPPAPTAEALAFAKLVPGPTQRDADLAPISTLADFTFLCESAGARGNLIADAYLAALAVESGSEWVTADRDFGRFPDLRWKVIELR